jgi:hypothetical protein
VRNVTSRFNSRRINRSDYEFYFQDLQPVAAHDMGILACHFARKIEGDEAEHHYSKEAARKLTSPEYDAGRNTICPPHLDIDGRGREPRK